MLKKNPHVYVTRLLPEIILNRMSELFNLEVNNSDKQLNSDDLKKVFNEFDVVVPTVTDKINTEIIKSLRVYGSVNNAFTLTGYNGIDPEVNTSGLNPGIDRREKFPTVTTFTLGLSARF